jgi:hypothetical protein
MDVLQVSPDDMPLSEALKKDVAADNVYKNMAKFLHSYTKSLNL